jgi:hypothetical protein
MTAGTPPGDLNVVCIKWGTKFSPEYVNNLFRGVRRHLTLPHRFVCLTDDPRGIDPGVEIKPLTDGLPGWWNKLTLFKPQPYDLTGTILFFDLDMIVIRSIDPLARYPGEFLAVLATESQTEYWSGFLRFPVGRYARLWELFEPRREEVIREIYGDQDWINACAGERHGRGAQSQKARLLWPEITPERSLIEPLPRSWFSSYKRDLKGQEDRLSEDTRVIVFHGVPMVHEVDWVLKYWRGDA